MKNVKPLNTAATQNYKQRVNRSTSESHSHDPNIGKSAKPKETPAPKTPNMGGAPAPKTPPTPTPKTGGRVGGYGS